MDSLPVTCQILDVLDWKDTMTCVHLNLQLLWSNHSHLFHTDILSQAYWLGWWWSWVVIVTVIGTWIYDPLDILTFDSTILAHMIDRTSDRKPFLGLDPQGHHNIEDKSILDLVVIWIDHFHIPFFHSDDTFRNFLLLFLSFGFISRSKTKAWKSLNSWTSGSFSSLLEFFLAHEFSSRGLSPFLIRYMRDFSSLSKQLFKFLRCCGRERSLKTVWPEASRRQDDDGKEG